MGNDILIIWFQVVLFQLFAISKFQHQKLKVALGQFNIIAFYLSSIKDIQNLLVAVVDFLEEEIKGNRK